MTQNTSQNRVYTTNEFDRWWEAQGQAIVFQDLLDADAARHLAWEAWRKGREQLSEATASPRPQLARR